MKDCFSLSYTRILSYVDFVADMIDEGNLVG